MSMLDAAFCMLDDEETGIRSDDSYKAAAAAGVFFGLHENHVNNMLRACDSTNRYRGRKIPGPLHHDAVEHDSSLRGFRRRRSKSAQSIGRPVQNLLATYFRVHLPPRLFRSRCTGYYPGFFSYAA